MNQKKCRVCNELKPFSEFYKAPKNRDFLRNLCKSCCRAEAKDYRAAMSEEEKEELQDSIISWKEENPEAVKIHSQRWREKQKN